MSKIHEHLVDKVTDAWQEIFVEGRYADKVIEKYLKSEKKWGSRDRRFFAESVYEGVRWWRRLWAILDIEINYDRKNLKKIWAILAYKQSWISDPRPWGVDLDLIQNSKKILATKSSAVLNSIPDWLQDLGVKELGEKVWTESLQALNKKAPVDLRFNSLKTDISQLQKKLIQEDIETLSTEIPQSFEDLKLQKKPNLLLTLPQRKNVFATDAFKLGLFEVQDRSSQAVALMLDPQPGERIVDACAGAGGKSLHIGSLMKNKGRIISLDIHEWKLLELQKRARRNGIHIIETKVIDSTKVIKRLSDSADRVLLDVPCSGLGVLRRNPDTKWKLTIEELKELRKTQSELLKSYSRMVKTGGVLVYATCSLLPSENKKQVEGFLNSNWTLVDELVVLPAEGRGDGFYAAKMLRKS